MARPEQGRRAYTYRYPHFAVTADCVVFGFDIDVLRVLLIQRASEPFQSQWALPGGFLSPGETTEDAARRELREETGLDQVFLEQLYTFSEPDRDPREHVVTVAYYALVKLSEHHPEASSDAAAARWFPVSELPRLAFDHQRIVDVALDRLRGKVRYQPIGFELLRPKFTLSELQCLYEVVLRRPLDKRNFRRKILSMDLLAPLDETQAGVAHRAARLYRFDKRRYQRLQAQGFNFEI